MIEDDPDHLPDIKIAGLSIWVFFRDTAGDDFWDGNSLDCLIRVEAHGACVEIRNNDPRTYEFAEFLLQLETAQTSLDGRASLIFSECGFVAELAFEKTGHIQMKVDVTPDLVFQKHFFEFAIDQSYVPGIISSCRKILKQYPVNLKCQTEKYHTQVRERYGQFAEN